MGLRDEFVNKDPAIEAKKSWSWFKNNVNNIRAAAQGMSSLQFLGDNQPHQRAIGAGIVPGTMISYFYDPKFKKELPYYDTFPLLLPFNYDDIHFIGLNLHYLEPRLRLIVLQKLMDYISDDSLNPKAKLGLSWELLKQSSHNKLIEKCVKQYLFSHVKSNYIVIPPAEWRYTVCLPLERFKKASNETVWKG